LQEFTPVHFTFASSALAVEIDRLANSSAAAVAIATPPALVVIFTLLAPWVGTVRSIIAPPAASQVAETAYLPSKTGDVPDVLQQNTARRIQL
jgi:hypothetical protein